MLGLIFLPVHHANCPALSDILDQEERSWMGDLSWDFSPIRRILTSYLAQKLLPGFAAVSENKVLGYTYFLVHQRKGIVGTVFASPESETQTIADELLKLAIDALKKSEGMRRIEAQIIAFNNIQLTAVFTRNGFQYHPRYYLELDLSGYHRGAEPGGQETIASWNSAYIPHMADMTLASYRNQVDALLCEDYCTLSGCEGYLRSVVDNPGCGVFVPEASFVALDSRGTPCGFVLASRISSAAGMIPQIAIAPSHQGRGLGAALIHESLSYFRTHGLRTVSLTVTKRNRRAFEWYQRLGFKIRKEFGAYVWNRENKS
jgi:ribosomal protein S18 acetylase RimI-like enzyme